MRKTILVFIVLQIINNYMYAQENKLPEGWDKISLNGKVAYMNLITGEVSKTLPNKPASNPQVKKEIEYDPTIIHKVQKGETLSIIARKYNLNLGKLYQLNSIVNFDTIEIGDEIVVGYKDNKQKTNVSFENKKVINAPTKKKVHTVNPGDTLYSIARYYGKSVTEIKKVNDLKSNAIFIGQSLLLE